MSRKGVTCRFRKDLDEDLVIATKNLNNGELSELCRNGLRLMLGIRTTKQIEVKELPIITPQTKYAPKEKTATPHSKPTVFISNNLRPRN